MKKNNAPRKESFQGLDLAQEEIDIMKEQFFILDRQKTGYISLFDVKSLFEAVGEYQNQSRMSSLQAWLEERSSNKKIDLNLALRGWSHLKELIIKEEEDDFDVDICCIKKSSSIKCIQSPNKNH